MAKRMIRKTISAFTFGAGALFIVIGANEADYVTEIGQIGYRWLQYLLTGMVLVLVGAIGYLGGRK